MRETWKAASVGLMVVVGVLATVAVYRYVDERSSAKDGYQVYALFSDAQGLIPKSRVVVAGIPIGYIESIRLEGNLARVDLQINEDVVLHEDANVAMKSVSLLGEQVIVVHPGTSATPPIKPGGRLKVATESVSTDDLLQTANDIAQNIKAVTAQLERSFGSDEAGERMESALLNLSDALDAVNRTIQANEQVVNRTLSNVERATEQGTPRLIRILDNVELATRNLSEVIDEQRPDLQRGVAEIDDTIASVHRASEEMEGVLSDLHQVTGRTARGEGTLGRLTQDEALIDEVEGAAEGINNLVGGLARLQTIVELRSEYNFLANTFKTYFSLRLQPRESRYFLVQLVDDPRGEETVTETLVERSPGRSYQERRVELRESLKYTLMMAKRVSFATFRFGVLESTGGLGLDLNFWKDRIEFNADVFAIGVQASPRIRLRASFELIDRLSINAGADDILNSRRDFFLGLMLRFNDEDVKSLLPFAGAISP